MADEAKEVNTAVEQSEAQQQLDEPQVAEAALDVDRDGPEGAERPAESGWSAPLRSLARKATETISSGVSYAAAQRSLSTGSAASAPGDWESQNDLGDTSKTLPGGWLLFAFR